MRPQPLIDYQTSRHFAVIRWWMVNSYGSEPGRMRPTCCCRFIQTCETRLLDCPYPRDVRTRSISFRTGTSDILSVKKGLWRTLHSAFVLSKVKYAHPHRFRHTLATEILITGGSIEAVAEILGASPAIVRKHYKRWCVAYQARITRIYESVHRTPTVQQNFQQSKLLKEKNNEWWPGTESHSTTHA